MQKWGCTSWAVNYWQGVLMSLYNSIPKEYEHKETILEALFKIKDKLMRTAPEIMSQTYIDETMRLIKFLPKNQTDWDSLESWNIIRTASIEANKVIKAITNNN